MNRMTLYCIAALIFAYALAQLFNGVPNVHLG